MFDTSYGYSVSDGLTLHVFEDERDMEEFVSMFDVDTGNYNEPRPCIIHHFSVDHAKMRTRTCSYESLDMKARNDG